MRHSAKNGNSIPKTAPASLPGVVCERYHKCGKANCRCTRGALHGPYFRRQWYDGGRLRSAYVRPRDLDAVRKACAAWHREQQEAREECAAMEQFYMHEFREMRAQLRAEYGRYGWRG